MRARLICWLHAASRVLLRTPLQHVPSLALPAQRLPEPLRLPAPAPSAPLLQAKGARLVSITSVHGSPLEQVGGPGAARGVG